MEVAKITCDQCGKDLTSTGNCEDWRLALINQPIPHKGPTATSMAIPPILDGAKHFCGLGCLASWVVKKIPEVPHAAK